MEVSYVLKTSKTLLSLWGGNHYVHIIKWRYVCLNCYFEGGIYPQIGILPPLLCTVTDSSMASQFIPYMWLHLNVYSVVHLFQCSSFGQESYIFLKFIAHKFLGLLLA